MNKYGVDGIAAIVSGAAHMPLPIWAWPGKPAARPISTLRLKDKPRILAA